MKKLLTVLFVLTAIMVNAQSLELKHNGQVINNNDTIAVPISLDRVVNNLYVEYANLASQDLYFKVKKEEITLANGAQATFCVGGTCYTGTQSQEIFLGEGDAVTLEDETNVFHATYTTSQTGVSVVKYKFYNTDNEDDQVSFYVVYTVGTGVQSVTTSNSALKAYPNPAHNSVTIDYSAACNNAQLVIKNLAGAVLYREKVNGIGKMSVSLSDFSAGVYFYGLECDGRMQQTKKLVVK